MTISAAIMTKFWVEHCALQVMRLEGELEDTCRQLDRGIWPLRSDLLPATCGSFLWGVQCLRERTDLRGCVGLSLRHLRDEVSADGGYQPGGLARWVAEMQFGQSDEDTQGAYSDWLSAADLRRACEVVDRLRPAKQQTGEDSGMRNALKGTASDGESSGQPTDEDAKRHAAGPSLFERHCGVPGEQQKGSRKKSTEQPPIS